MNESIDQPDSQTCIYYRVHTSFHTTALLYYSAPYSQDEEVTVPVGVVLVIAQEKLAKGYDEVPASLVHHDEWAQYIIQTGAGSTGYELYLDRSFLGTHCELMTAGFNVVAEPLRLCRAIQGCLFGTAVADAIGLPFEGLKPTRIERLHGLPLRHRFFFAIGMMSDDTEHTCMVAQSLVSSGGDPKHFARAMAWRLRWWFFGLPGRTNCRGTGGTQLAWRTLDHR